MNSTDRAYLFLIALLAWFFLLAIDNIVTAGMPVAASVLGVR